MYKGQVFCSQMESGTLTAAATSSNSKKVATHSHIKGLGLNETGHAEMIASGFVGQIKAREVRNRNEEKKSIDLF